MRLISGDPDANRRCNIYTGVDELAVAIAIVLAVARRHGIAILDARAGRV